MGRYSMVFLFSFAVFLSFLTPNVNTGDAGELVTASYFLGTAHPSGYPLYLMLAKSFAFLPFGNMAFKAALVSAVFSSLSLTLIYWLVLRLTSSTLAAAFTGVLLLTSPSYFTQSVIIKFYPLNLFLILALFSIWLIQLQFPVDSRSVPNPVRALYLSSFITGLITANHHTGILMSGAVIIAWFMCRRNAAPVLSKGVKVWGLVLTMTVLFFAGFVINAYLLARGGAEHPVNVFYTRDLKELFMLISRQAYGESGTINIAGSTAGSLFSGWHAYWYGLRNFIFILGTNFSFFSFPLFFSGCFYLWRKNFKILIFSIAGLVAYGPFLAGLALSTPDISHMNYYVVANQYFLPAFAIYALFAGLGFFQVMHWLRIPQYKILQKILPVVIAVFFAVILYFRAGDSNYRTNHVPYQAAKDTYSILPVNSIFLAFGDNERFQGRYIKLAGRYREDICHLNAVTLQSAVRGVAGCRDASYSSISPDAFKREFNEMIPFMSGRRFFSDAGASKFFPLKEYVNAGNFSMIYVYLPWALTGADDDSGSLSSDSLLRNRLPLVDKLINPDVCSPRLTDDMFTGYLCDKYIAHLSELIKFYIAK